jgi:hypothetical protein
MLACGTYGILVPLRRTAEITTATKDSWMPPASGKRRLCLFAFLLSCLNSVVVLPSGLEFSSFEPTRKMQVAISTVPDCLCHLLHGRFDERSSNSIDGSSGSRISSTLQLCYTGDSAASAAAA